MDPDLEAVARAYRRVRETGAMDFPARVEAERVYRDRHPEAGPELSRVVAHLIHQASVPEEWPTTYRTTPSTSCMP